MDYYLYTAEYRYLLSNNGANTMKTNNGLNNLEKIVNGFGCTNLVPGIQNYLIDTSAKIVSYAPVMAAMEAYNGLTGEQIIKSRISAALIDSFVARIYGKTLDYMRRKFNADPKSRGLKNYLIDTATMIGVYSPVYAGILYVAGANSSQIASALGMGAAIAAITARSFAKYVLGPWRKMCKYKS